MTSYHVSIDRVGFHWPGSSETLQEISGEITEGTWLALIGPNGAGKTTLLRLMAGLEIPSLGRIHVGQRALREYSHQQRAGLLALMPQAMRPAFELEVRTVVEMGQLRQLGFWDRIGRPRASHREAVDEALVATDTYALAKRKFTDLSGGEARRVLLAMVLAQQTPILLLDEPIAYLDPGHAKDLLERIERLVREQRKTVIMAYHDLTTVGLYCDQIWALEQGRIRLQGAAAEVLCQPELKALFGLDFLTLTHPTRKRPVLLWS